MGSLLAGLKTNQIEMIAEIQNENKKKTPWSESAIELYRPSDCRLSVKLVPTFADRGRHVVGVTDPLRPYSRLSRTNRRRNDLGQNRRSLSNTKCSSLTRKWRQR
jgi:hypothetical protein